MAQVSIAEPAEEDLEAIWDYIGLDSPAAADRYLKMLMAEITKLGAHTGMGRRRDEFAPGLRSWPCGNYLIYYRVKDGVVQILRVVHGARSQRDALGDLAEH